MIAKLVVIYLIMLVIVAALAPMPQAQAQVQQPQRVILPLYDALDLALAGKVRVVRYV